MEQNFVRIAITQPDGNVAIMQFMTLVKRNPEDPGFVREPTPENIEAEITKSRIAFTSWRIIQDTDIPQDRIHRDAWTDDGGKIVPDAVKAAAIDEKRKLDAAVNDKLKAQQDALVASVQATLDGALKP